MDFKLRGDNTLIDAMRVAVRLLEERPQRIQHLKRQFYEGIIPGERPLQPDEADELKKLEDEDVQVRQRGQTWDSMKRELESIVRTYEAVFANPQGRAVCSLNLILHPVLPTFEDLSKEPAT